MEQILLALPYENEIGYDATRFRLPSTEPGINTGRGITWIDPPLIGFSTSDALRDPGAERTCVEINFGGFER
jgi:hypothetical protein